MLLDGDNSQPADLIYECTCYDYFYNVTKPVKRMNAWHLESLAVKRNVCVLILVHCKEKGDTLALSQD